MVLKPHCHNELKALMLCERTIKEKEENEEYIYVVQLREPAPHA